MKSAKPYAFRSYKPCSTREDLHHLKARIEAARSMARNLYRAVVVKTTDSSALENLEEELKQTSAAHKLIYYAVPAHLPINTPRRAVSAWRRNGPGKES